jgi:hypothetical protein
MEIGIAFENSEDWNNAASLVRDKYRRSFDADIMPQPSCFVVCRTRPAQGDGGMQTVACAGVSFSGAKRLFSEIYLDEPIEQIIARQEGETVKREVIAEIGSLASVERDAGIELVRLLPIVSWCLGKHYVLCTATRQLTRIFERVGYEFIQLQHADASRLNEKTNRWGTYYENRPETGYFRVIDALAQTFTNEVARYSLSNVKIILKERHLEERYCEAC